MCGTKLSFQSGNRSESFTKIKQGSKEVISGIFFLQRLTPVVNRMVSDPAGEVNCKLLIIFKNCREILTGYGPQLINSS